MATPPQMPETWYDAVIDLMIHERIPLLMAASRLQVTNPPLSPEEASAHERRKCFKEMYTATINREYARSAAAVKDKDLVLGRMAANAGTLEKMGKPKEANDSLAAIGKLQGWSTETTVNVFNESPAEIEEARKRLLNELARKPTVN